MKPLYKENEWAEQVMRLQEESISEIQNITHSMASPQQQRQGQKHRGGGGTKESIREMQCADMAWILCEMKQTGFSTGLLVTT